MNHLGYGGIVHRALSQHELQSSRKDHELLHSVCLQFSWSDGCCNWEKPGSPSKVTTTLQIVNNLMTNKQLKRSKPRIFCWIQKGSKLCFVFRITATVQMGEKKRQLWVLLENAKGTFLKCNTLFRGKKSPHQNYLNNSTLFHTCIQTFQNSVMWGKTPTQVRLQNCCQKEDTAFLMQSYLPAFINKQKIV